MMESLTHHHIAGKALTNEGLKDEGDLMTIMDLIY